MKDCDRLGGKNATSLYHSCFPPSYCLLIRDFEKIGQLEKDVHLAKQTPHMFQNRLVGKQVRPFLK